jgi:hypothetical protein
MGRKSNSRKKAQKTQKEGERKLTQRRKGGEEGEK